MQKCLDIKRSPFWSVFPFPDTLVNNPGNLWNIVVSYCVISRKLCHNAQVRNSFWRLMESGYIENLEKWEQICMCYKQAGLLCRAQWMVVSEAGAWQLLQLVWLCWFIFVTSMRQWCDSRHFIVSPDCETLQGPCWEYLWWLLSCHLCKSKDRIAPGAMPGGSSHLLGTIFWVLSRPRAMHGSWAEANNLDLDG